MEETVYEWLGVPWTVDQQTLRRLHSQKLREYPHERYPEQFMDVQERFRHVKDARSRLAYDRMLFNTDVLSFRDECQTVLQWKDEGRRREALQLAERLIEVSEPYGIVWPAYVELLDEVDEASGRSMERLLRLEVWDEWHCQAMLQIWHKQIATGWKKETFERMSDRLALEAMKLDEEERQSLGDWLIQKESEIFPTGEAYEEAYRLLDALQLAEVWGGISVRWKRLASQFIAYEERVNNERKNYENARQTALGLVDTVDQIATAYERAPGQEAIAAPLRKVASVLAIQLRPIGYEEIDLQGQPFNDETMETNDVVSMDEKASVVSVERRAFYDEETGVVRKGYVVTES